MSSNDGTRMTVTGWKSDRNDEKFTRVIFFWALRSPCSCHRLNTRWLCLLYQTHKVPLFQCCTSITHGNRICFVSVAATSVNKTETSEIQEKALANRQVPDYFQVLAGRFSDLNHSACPSSQTVFILSNGCNYYTGVLDVQRSQQSQIMHEVLRRTTSCLIYTPAAVCLYVLSHASGIQYVVLWQIARSMSFLFELDPWFSNPLSIILWYIC